MTFTKKKIEEFEKKLISVVQDAVSCEVVEQKNLDDLKNWLRKALAEEERKAYLDMQNALKEGIGMATSFCEEKLKELEQE